MGSLFGPPCSNITVYYYVQKNWLPTDLTQ